jgi:ferric-dicitrate binding protein FerR (iron transport regulator)
LVAASLAILMVASAGVYWQFFYNPGILLATQFGEQLQTSLPDGSVVTLNANSHLRYRKQDPRKVWLDGEAYFEIEKKPETGAQFLVITPDLQVTVLGTSFNVNTRNDATKVFLQEGKVMLDVADPATGLIEMSPGDLIIYSQDHKELQEHRRDASALQTASWKEGALIFKDKLLTDALFDIEDIYGIQFIIKTDDLLRETITGGVPIRDLQVTLNTLSEVYGIEMKAVGKRYFITGRH